jgi:hypothetical protein
MTKITLALAELYRGERALGRRLTSIAARHHSDQDICHLAQDLARWSDEHAQALADRVRGDGGHLPRPAVRQVVTAPLQTWVSDILRHRPEPALLLLADLRRVHRCAAGVSLDWELLAQAAQATRDDALLDLTKRCHPQTLRQMRWANAMLKELSPQALGV